MEITVNFLQFDRSPKLTKNPYDRSGKTQILKQSCRPSIFGHFYGPKIGSFVFLSNRFAYYQCLQFFPSFYGFKRYRIKSLIFNTVNYLKNRANKIFSINNIQNNPGALEEVEKINMHAHKIVILNKNIYCLL